jgi:hypothetical protein
MDECEEKQDESLEERPLFNPASIIHKMASAVPYAEEKLINSNMFSSLQLKPHTISEDIVQIFYWYAIVFSYKQNSFEYFLSSASSIIQTQIKDDFTSDKVFNTFSEFDAHFPSLSPEMGGKYWH